MSHVPQPLGLYNMIIGRDLLKSLGLILDFSTRTIIWNDAIIPMKESAAAPIKSFHIDNPSDVDEMVGRLAGDTYKKYYELKMKKPIWRNRLRITVLNSILKSNMN